MPVTNSAMMPWQITRVLAGLVVGALSATPCLAAQATDLTKADWGSAIENFYEAERNSPSVYDISDASRCRGRWALHADMVDDGAFPAIAESIFTQPLRLPGALSNAEFFLIEQRDIAAYHSAYDEAERNLAHALMGNRSAALSYFTKLGECYSTPESASDNAPEDMPAGATDAPVERTVANSDFDEPENLRRLIFVEKFANSLSVGERVADYFAAEFDFTFTARHDCGATITQSVQQLPASDIDIGFMFWVTIPDDSKECANIPESEEMEVFNLEQTASRWSQIDVLVEDHNFATFVVGSPDLSDFLLVHIAPHSTGFVVSKLAYNRSGL